jgi:hypothetical protein
MQQDSPLTTSRRREAARRRAFRGNSLGLIMMLLVQYGFGVWTNLYVILPRSDNGKSTFSAFSAAVTGNSIVLVVHALLGTLLIVSALAALVRAIQLRRSLWIGLTLIGLLAILAAWASGARFVGHSASSASFSMAVATGVALFSYALVVFVSGESA